MRKTRVLAALVAGATLTLAACGTVGSSGGSAAAPKPANEVTIGFAARQMDAPYYVAMQSVAEQKSKDKGFKLLFQNANGDPVTQINQVQTMLSQGADVIVVDAISPETERAQLTQVAGQVPLLFVDTGIPDVGVTSIQSDNHEIGRLSGLLTAKRIGSGKTIQVGVLNGGPNDEIVGPARQSGFLEGLQQGGVTAQVVASASGTYTQEQAVPATESMLAANPGIGLMLALNDSMALGALQVLRNQGNTKVLVAASADGQKEALAEIAKGCDSQYVSTGLNSPNLAADAAFDAAIGIATGSVDPKTLPKTQNTRAEGINCENVSQFYDPKSIF
ncbi:MULTISPECIES: substrate-binding domain-containing protein [Amycolatopsis]|uniref:Ribose transport system substrate-binding protein n=2 Tax=Amycolatopsis TaxID=1813 RepID=A0A1I3Q861_9PSEU|nr:substrate-binding domain-containing protein [Amycolatopsis sacchari]SFJ29306.1 ribose transport system substrate-binding protein [Amycolatopsis sacchari]